MGARKSCLHHEELTFAHQWAFLVPGTPMSKLLMHLGRNSAAHWLNISDGLPLQISVYRPLRWKRGRFITRSRILGEGFMVAEKRLGWKKVRL